MKPIKSTVRPQTACCLQEQAARTRALSLGVLSDSNIRKDKKVILDMTPRPMMDVKVLDMNSMLFKVCGQLYTCTLSCCSQSSNYVVLFCFMLLQYLEEWCQ